MSEENKAEEIKSQALKEELEAPKQEETLLNQKELKELLEIKKLRCEIKSLSLEWFKYISLALAAVFAVYTFLSELNKRTDEKFAMVMQRFAEEAPELQLSAAIEIKDFFNKIDFVPQSFGFVYRDKIRNFISTTLRMWDPEAKNIEVRDALIKSWLEMGKKATRGANLRGANLQKADLGGADLQEAQLGEAYLREANLGGAHLQNANLRGTHLQNVNLSRAHLKKVYLSGAHLQNANLGDVELQEAIMCGAELQEAIMNGAHLQEAYLTGANLQKAHLSGADFQKARLSEADLRGVINLTIEQLYTAETLYHIQLDPELMEKVKQNHPHLLEKPTGEQNK